MHQSKTLNSKSSVAEVVYFWGLNLIERISSQKSYLKVGRVILCYHSVDNSGWRFSTPPKEFEKQIKYLKRKFEIVNLSEILSKQPSQKPLATITFDDGYRSVYENAFPIMDKLKLTGTIFLIGNTKDRDLAVLDNSKELLHQKHINILKKTGWNLGYHTHTHRSLRNLSLRHLKKELYSKFDYFAYPNGYYDDKIIATLKKFGYKYAFTVDGGVLRVKNRFLLNRIPMEGKINLIQFKSLLTPIGLVFSKIFMNLLKVKEELFGHK